MTARFLLLPLAAASLAGQNVTFDRLLRAAQEPQNWLTYSGSVQGRRYSPLAQITPANVKNLELNWVWQARSTEKFEATALVVDGVLYTVAPSNDVVALDAATGRQFWVYPYTNGPDAAPCCGRVNRGLAILGDTLFMGTLDAHLIAIDAKTGKPLWNTSVGDPKQGYTLTHAPLVVKDKVIIGPAGGDRGIRGFIAAYDARTGKEVWRFNTVPGPGEPGHESWAGDSWMQGGAAIWTTGSYDPETNLTFWGTGNPGPDWNGEVRIGDNLYSDSVVALDADTGKLKWYYQFTPHDEFDYDSTQVPVLADVEWQGRTRKAMLWANRNGFFYVLDRTSGQFLQAKPFAKVTWANGFDEKGRPMRVAGQLPSNDLPGTQVYPALGGATNWFSPSYSPKTNLFYIPTVENTSSSFTRQGFPSSPVNIGLGQTTLQPNLKSDAEGYGAIRAYDPNTGDRRWEFKMGDVTQAGVLSTGSDLVFSGGRDGYFFALDGKTGALLWKASLGGQIIAGPMSYSVNGKQYVAVTAGSALFSFALRP